MTSTHKPTLPKQLQQTKQQINYHLTQLGRADIDDEYRRALQRRLPLLKLQFKRLQLAILFNHSGDKHD